MRRQLCAVSVVILLMAVALSVHPARLADTTPVFDRMETKKIRLQNDAGVTLVVEARIADDSSERAAGFQRIAGSVIQQSLILFVYPAETAAVYFHMFNVSVPIDIAFIRSDGTILNTQTMQPGGNRYHPGQPFRYALEARASFFREHGITPRASRLLLESGKETERAAEGQQ